MKEYTILAAFSAFAAVFLDIFLRVRVLKRREFWVFLGCIFLLKLLVNGYLTGSGIVQYNPVFFLGVRLGSIPLEDFFFGFSMVVMTIVLWEFGKRKEKGVSR